MFKLTALDLHAGVPIRFDYTNWKGEESTRNVRPIEILFGSTEYHEEEQWLLLAFDVDKKAERSFAMKDMRNISFLSLDYVRSKK